MEKDPYKFSYKTSGQDNLSLSVYNTGYQRCEPGYTWGPATRDHYLLHFVTEGKGVLKGPCGTLEIPAGGLFFIRPGELCCYVADEETPWEYYWVGFNGTEAHRMLGLTPFGEQVQLIFPENPDRIRRCLKRIYDARGNSPAAEARMLGGLYLFLGALMEESGSGSVRQSVLDLGTGIEPDELYPVSRILSSQMQGCRLSELPERLLRMAGSGTGGVGTVVQAMAEQQPEEASSDISALVIGGRSNLLNFPEYSDVDKARSLLSVLETREKMVSLLSSHGEMEISVRIGPETGMEEMKDCSIVTASYRLSDGRVNTIGLNGPTRMQYGKVLAVLGQVGRSLTELLEEQTRPDPEGR